MSWVRCSPFFEVLPVFRRPAAHSIACMSEGLRQPLPAAVGPAAKHITSSYRRIMQRHIMSHAAPYNELISPDWCPNLLQGPERHP